MSAVAPAPMEKSVASSEADSLMDKSALGDMADDDDHAEDCDPFLRISIPALRQSKRTRYLKGNRNPNWDETLTFSGVTGRMEMMDIRCMVRCRRSCPLLDAGLVQSCACAAVCVPE